MSPIPPARARQIEQRRDRLSTIDATSRAFTGRGIGVYGLDTDCEECGGPTPPQTHQGNPRRWCSESCRLRNYRARQRAQGGES